MKINVTVSKTIQERQYEPTSVSVSWELTTDDILGRIDESKRMYQELSDLVDALLFERTGRKVRRS